MHDDRTLAEARLKRVLDERLRPAVYPESVPLDVAVWHAPGEPVPVAEGLAAEPEPVEVGTRWGAPWGTSWFRVTGTVPEVESHLRRCALAVAPLRQARGVQNKVLEATGLGIPSVVTSAVADGLPPEIQRTCGVADTAEEFARHVVERLSLPPGERRALVVDANLQALSWERQLGPLVTILAAASHRCAAL